MVHRYPQICSVLRQCISKWKIVKIYLPIRNKYNVYWYLIPAILFYVRCIFYYITKCTNCLLIIAINLSFLRYILAATNTYSYPRCIHRWARLLNSNHRLLFIVCRSSKTNFHFQYLLLYYTVYLMSVGYCHQPRNIIAEKNTFISKIHRWARLLNSNNRLLFIVCRPSKTNFQF